MKPGLWQTIHRASRLRCPACGQGRVAKSWRETHEVCPQCGFDLHVEGGFYLGSIYLNYGLIGVLLLAVGLPLVWFEYVSPGFAIGVGVALCIALPVWFWRYARSLWLGFGYYVDHTVRAGQRREPSAGPVGQPLEYLNAGDESFECACTFCHQRFSVARSQQNSWGSCPSCGEQIFFVAVRT